MKREQEEAMHLRLTKSCRSILSTQTDALLHVKTSKENIKKRRKSKEKHNDELQIVNDSGLNQVHHVSTMTSTVNIIAKNLICRSTLKI